MVTPSMPSPSATGGPTLAKLLEARAADSPDRPFIVMDGGDARTYGAFNREVNQLAHGMADAGVSRGDRVAIVLPNSLQHVVTGFALRKLGAVEVAVHTRARGAQLAHILRTSAPRLIVLEASMAEALSDLGTERPGADLAVVGDLDAARDELPGVTIEPFAALIADRDDDPGVAVHDAELASVLFTSGTTGPSKGCMLSHRYAATMGRYMVERLRLREDDCFYCPFPMSHVDSPYLTVGPALWTGGRAALGRRFSVSGFWDEVRAFGATVFDFMGATLTMLHNQDERPSDADNPVRLAWGAPVPEFAPAFERRFGLRIVSGYGLTDAGMVTWCDPDAEEPRGSCGRPQEPYEIRIADRWDDPVASGEVGEILVRTSSPNVMMLGYYGMPEATAETVRNGWLHTGDLGRLDEHDRLFFEGRRSESIRRRGENISSWEIEQVLESHPDVLEAVAIGVPSPLTEEEVHAFVVARASATLTSQDVIAFARTRMADFMVPSGVDLVEAIPKTETGKPEKFKLRALATREELAPPGR